MANSSLAMFPVVFFVLSFFFNFAPRAEESAPVNSTVFTNSKGPFWDRLVLAVDEKNLDQNLQWQRLLHYQTDLLFLFKRSQVDGPEFFLDPDGAWSPRKELLATVRGFFFHEEFEGRRTHPQCQFPARLEFLRKNLPLDAWGLKLIDCANFEAFRKQVDPVGLSLIFSSYHLKSPQSMFGHTLFRFKKRRDDPLKKDLELLDFGINFAASTPDGTNPVWFAVGGLMGGFKGEFSSVPFFFKVREYQNFESRDLWTYDLNLNQGELDFMVKVIWELGWTHFNYYFFTENCSYHMLSVVEAVRPSLNLKQHLPLWAIPSDSVKAFTQSRGLVTDIHFRPSQRRIFLNRFETLSGPEKSSFFIALQTDPLNLDAIATLDAESKRRVMDVLIDYFHFKNPLVGAKKVAALEKEKFRLLSARANLGGISPEVEIPRPTAEEPHLGHGSFRWGVLGATGPRDALAWDLDLRFAFHDLVDPSAGFPQTAGIEFLNANLRFKPESKTLWLEKMTYLNLQGLLEYDSVSKPMSTEVLVRSQRWIEPDGCTTCLRHLGQFSPGLLFKIQDQLHVFGLLDLGLENFKRFERHWRVFLGPRAGFLHRLSESFSYKFQISSHYRITDNWLWAAHLEGRQALWNSKMAFSFEAGILPSDVSARAGFHFYY